jgi:hypothetical protein
MFFEDFTSKEGIIKLKNQIKNCEIYDKDLRNFEESITTIKQRNKAH